MPQKPYIFYSEAPEANSLHRAANSSETAAQRIHRQQAAMNSQLQRIDESLGRSTNGQTSVPGADRPRWALGGDHLLLGVGSQFNFESDPAPFTTEPGRGGCH